MLGGSVAPGGGRGAATQHLHIQVGPGSMSARSPLFRRRSLLDRSCLGLGLVALLIGLAQERLDDAGALLLPDLGFLGFLRLLLFGQELVVYFPAHLSPPSMTEST